MKRFAAGIGLVVSAAIASVAVAISSSAAAPVTVLSSKPIILAQADVAAPAAPAPAAPDAAVTAATPAAPAGGVDQAGLPLGPGHDLTVAKCSGCHDVSEFSGQRHTADDWGGIVGDMIGRGADINDADFTTIQNYLATNLPPAPAAPAGAAAAPAAPAAPVATPNAAVAPAAPATPAGGVDQAGLPLGPGHDLTVAKCSGCHDVSEFSGQRHTADDWGGIVGDMIGRGADINDADFKTIQDYLATNLPPAPAGPAAAPAAPAAAQ